MCTAKFLQLLRRARCGAVDVDTRSQLLGENSVLRPTPNCGDLVAKFLRELNSQMSEAADPLDGHQVTRQCPAVPQRVECRNSRTQQGRGFRGIERFRHGRHCFRRGNHVLAIAAVEADSGNPEVCAVREIAPPASQAGSVLPAVPANADALALPPLRHACAHLVDHTSHFVSWHARVHDARPAALFREYIAMTDPARLHAYPHLASSRLRDLPLGNFEVRSCPRYLRHFHLRHRLSPLQRKSTTRD